MLYTRHGTSILGHSTRPTKTPPSINHVLSAGMLKQPYDSLKGVLQVSLSFSRTRDLSIMANYSIFPAAVACNASAVPWPALFGADVVSLTADLVRNFSRDVSSELYYNHPSSTVRSMDFCNITVTYTHPSHNDTINIETWLPTTTWNGRLQAVGGGGWVAGRFVLSDVAMAGAVGEGYVATTSDAGVGLNSAPDPWALVSPGNVNLYALQDLASVALNDQVFTIHCMHVPSLLKKPGYHCQRTDQGLLRPKHRVLVLERLFSRWQTRTHARSTLPRCVRWYCSSCTGDQLGTFYSCSCLGASHDVHHRPIPTKMRD